MRRLLSALPLFFLALALAGITTTAVAAQPATSEATASQDSMVAKGELQKVDTQKQIFTIKASSGEELQFSYNDSTKVEGSSEGVQGLSSQSGTQVTVRYKEESGRRMATSIEINKSGGDK